MITCGSLSPSLRVLVAALLLTACSGSEWGIGTTDFNVTPQGDTVVLAGGLVVLVVPESAVTQNTLLTVQTDSSAPTSPLLVSGTAVDIGPTGLVFQRPVQLTVSYAALTLPQGVQGSELRINKATGGWWQVVSGSSANPTNQTVSASITGLSVYGILGVPVATVTVAPAAPSVTPGGSVQLTATLKDADGNVLPDRAVTWSSSAPGVASVSSTGLVTGVSAGSATITATSEAVNGTATVTVSAVLVASVVVAPATPSITVGGTVQLTATPFDAGGNTLAGRVVTWASLATGVATVSGTGLVTGVAAGSATISATSEGINGTATVTVAVVPVASVTVAPAAASITVGGTVQLTATPKDAGGNALAGRAVTWASTATGVATVNLSTGLVTGVAAGSATITASSEGVSGTASVTVQTGSSVTPAFQDNFETGSRAAAQGGFMWTGDRPTVVVSSDRAYSGNYSLKFIFGPDSLTPTDDSDADAFFQLGAYLTEVWFEYQLYVPANYIHRKVAGDITNNKFFAIWRDSYGWIGDNNLIVEYQPPDGAGTPVGYSRLRVFSSSSTSVTGAVVTEYFAEMMAPAARDFISPTGSVRPGEWNRIRIHLKLASAALANDGVFELWSSSSAGNTLVFQKLNMDLFPALLPNNLGVHNGYLLGWANSGFTQLTEFFVDDFKIFGANPGW